MSETWAFKSDAPQVIEAFDKAVEDYQRWGKTISEFAKGVHPKAKAVIATAWGEDSFMGVSVVEPVPDGWRVVHSRSGSDYMVPKKNTKIGKAADQRLQEIRRAPSVRTALPGMPSVLFFGGRSYTPGLFKHSDALYVSWSCDPAKADYAFSRTKELDESLWRPLKLSEFYAAMEESEAA